MKRILSGKSTLFLLTFAVLMLALTACSRESVEEITPEATEEETDEPTEEPSATPTEEPSATPTEEETEEVAEEEESTEAATEDTSAASSSTGGEQSSATEEATDEPTEEVADGPLPDFAPDEQSVWELDKEPYEFYSSEACAEPFYYNFYGRVALEPVQKGLNWTVPAGTTYYIEQQSENAYWGTGRHVIPGYQLTISVVFGSEDGLGVTYVLISDENPDCNHVFKHNAFRAW